MEEKLAELLLCAKNLRDVTREYVALCDSTGDAKPKKRERDWECSGQLWANAPCGGCDECDKQKPTVWGKAYGGDNKKYIMCSSCRRKFEKVKQQKKVTNKKE